MDLTPIPLAIASSSSRSHKNNAAELINLYVNLEEAGGKAKSLLLSTPGAEAITVFDYEILGFYKFNDVVYTVTKNKLYSVAKDPITGAFTPTVLGTVSLTGKVSFADNGIEMVFVAGGGYAYNPTTSTLKDMSTEPGWYPSNTVAYMDGYFIFSRSGTGQFFISDLYASTLNPIDWATGEAAPDDTVGVIVSNRQLWIIGEYSSEVWYDSGDPLFPFTRIPGAVIDIGAINYKTIAKARENIFLVGSDLVVYMSNGYRLQPISTKAIEYYMVDTDITLMSAFAFHERGRWFYALTISDNKTFVFDTQTQLWHTRESDNVGRWKMDGVFNYYDDGITYCYSAQTLYRMGEDLYQEDGANVKREIISLPLTKSVNRIRIQELELDMEVGLPVTATFSLQISSDGGKTWGNSTYASTGAIGEALARVRWTRLGQHRNAVAKFTTSSNTPITILSLNIRAG